MFPDASRPNFGIFVERQTCELAARQGVNLTVIAPVGVPPWPLSWLGRYRALGALPLHEQWKGLDVHRPRFPILPAIGGRFHPRSIAKSVLPLVKQLHAQEAFDVVDASFFYPDGPAAMYIGKALGLPFSIKARGADIHHWGRNPATAPMIRTAAEAASGLLAVSGAIREDMIALGMDGEKIRVHYTGVDLDRFVLANDHKSPKEALGLSGPVIICVGALIARKGQALLIRALTDLPGVTLVLAGAGPEMTEYRKLAKALGVQEQVCFLGSVPHDRLPARLAAADIMALPSASEGLANAWVEALACGTPIVISQAGGARELLDRPEAGCIAARDPGSIAAAITSILANPPAPEKVRETVMRFTWRANGDALLAHLRQIAGK